MHDPGEGPRITGTVSEKDKDGKVWGDAVEDGEAAGGRSRPRRRGVAASAGPVQR